MFRKERSETPAQEPGGIDTTLGAGCRVEGDLVIRGSARILGQIEGTVQVSGEVDVELGATIRGNLLAERARISGKIEGDVRVRDALELRQGAHLRGDVYARSFRIQDGAIFQGNCHMGRMPDGTDLRGEGVRPPAETGRA